MMEVYYELMFKLSSLKGQLCMYFMFLFFVENFHLSTITKFSYACIPGKENSLPTLVISMVKYIKIIPT